MGEDAVNLNAVDGVADFFRGERIGQGDDGCAALEQGKCADDIVDAVAAAEGDALARVDISGFQFAGEGGDFL